MNPNEPSDSSYPPRPQPQSQPQTPFDNLISGAPPTTPPDQAQGHPTQPLPSFTAPDDAAGVPTQPLPIASQAPPYPSPQAYPVPPTNPVAPPYAPPTPNSAPQPQPYPAPQIAAPQPQPSVQPQPYAAPPAYPSAPQAQVPPQAPGFFQRAATAPLNDDNAPAKPRVPLSAMVGMAAVAGALGVVLLSSVVSKIARPQKTTPQADSSVQVPAVATPRATISDKPQVEVQPMPNGPDDANISKPNDNGAANVAPSDADVPASTADKTQSQTEQDAAIPARRDQETGNDISSADDDIAGLPDERSTTRALSDATRNGVFRHPRIGYSVRPPAGFRLRRIGTRTTWKGADGSMLIETTDKPGPSARRGWERLDAAFIKKYGSRYRMLRLQDTLINGRPAAIWEFELTSRSGTVTRKMDVATMTGGRGYAALFAAPADRFETLRPQFEAALNSLQLPDAAPSSGY